MVKGSTAISNARWVGVSQAGRILVQLGTVVVLSRLLAPSDFGLLAMATIVTNFANLFRDMGTSAALIQKEELSGELIDTVFWANVGFGFCLAVLVAGSAPLAAFVLHEPRLTGVLAALAVAFPAASAGAPHLALLEREGRFRALAILEIRSALFSAAVGLIAAFCGFGVYSLVLQAVISAVSSTAQLWVASPWRPRLRWHQREFRSLWQFSRNLVGFNTVNYFVRNGDTILIGRFLGATELGWYSLAMRFLLFPVQNLAWLLNRALLPVYSRQQSDPARLAANYMRTLTMIAAVSAPLMFGLIAVRTPFVNVILGKKWIPVADLLFWLGPTGFLQSLGATTGSVLVSRGRTDTLQKIGLLNAAVIGAGFLIGVHFGVLGVAKAYFIATIFATTVSLHVTLAEVHSSLTALLPRIAPPIALAAVMAFVVAACEHLATSHVGASAVTLGSLILLGVAIYLAEIRLLNPILYGEFASLFADLLGERGERQVEKI